MNKKADYFHLQGSAFKTNKQKEQCDTLIVVLFEILPIGRCFMIFVLIA